MRLRRLAGSQFHLYAGIAKNEENLQELNGRFPVFQIGKEMKTDAAQAGQ